MSSSLVVATVDDRCPLGDRFSLPEQRRPAMPGGQSIWARWTAAPWHSACRARSYLGGDVGPQSRAWSGHRAIHARDRPADVVRADRPILDLVRDRGRAGVPTLDCARAMVRDALHLPRPVCDQHGRDDRGSVLEARFDVDDSSPPVGGLTGTATDAQTWSGHMRFGLNAADVGGGLFRAVVEVDGAERCAVPISASAEPAPTSVRDPALTEFAAAAAVPAADRRRIAGHRHRQPASGSAQSCGSCSRTRRATAPPIFGPLTRNIDARAGDRPGLRPRPPRRRQRRRRRRPGAADRALGPAGESDAARESLRSHPRRPRAPADRRRRADRQRGHRRGLEDDRGQRARAGQARRSADRQRRLVVPRASAARLLARRDLPLPQPRQRHDRVGDRKRAVARAGRACAWRSIRAGRRRVRRFASAAGCSEARCRGVASRSC